MRVRTLVATALACLSGACTDSADPMNVISPTSDYEAASLARQRFNGSVRVTPERARLVAGDTLRLAATTRVKGAQQLTPKLVLFKSSDTSIATVTQDGLVTGRRAGAIEVRVIAEGKGAKWRPARVPVVVTDSGDPYVEIPTLEEEIEGDTSTAPEEPPISAPVSAPAPAPTAPDTSAPAPTEPAPTAPAPTAPAPTPVFQPVPTAPAPPASMRPHEPAGFTPVANRPFNTKVPYYPTGTYPTASDKLLSEGFDTGEMRSLGFSIAKDPTAPTGDGLVGQMFYAADHQAGTAPGKTVKYIPPGAKSVYISIYAKLSSNWVGNESSTNKMFFFGTAEGNNQFFFSAHGRDHGPLIPNMMWQGVVGVDANNQRSRKPNVAPNTGQQIVRGVWQHWEFLFTCNSAATVFDGTADLWIDGKHITTANDISWFQGKYPQNPCDMNIFNWNPTYGGGGASPGADQYLWFDHVYISAK